MADYLDLNGSQFTEEMLRELPERYTFMDGLETVIEQNWMEYGAYRPHRFLPSYNVSLQDQEGRVIHHGQVVSSINIKEGDGDWEQAAGLDSSGWFYHGIGFNGSIAGNVADLYGYDRTIDGVLVPCNGTNAVISDHITAGDVEIKRVLSDGTLAVTANVNTKVAIQRAANMKPVGVITGPAMRETAGANIAYRMATAALSICKFGVLHIPYAITNAARINGVSKQPGTGDTGYTSVYNRHQFLTVTNAALMVPETPVRLDGNGHLILTADAATYPTQFGRIISWTNDTYQDLRSHVDTFPEGGLNVPGTMTGGLDRRLFDFVSLIRTAQGQTTEITDIVADVDAGYYGMIKIMFNTTTVI